MRSLNWIFLCIVYGPNWFQKFVLAVHFAMLGAAVEFIKFQHWVGGHINIAVKTVCCSKQISSFHLHNSQAHTHTHTDIRTHEEWATGVVNKIYWIYANGSWRAIQKEKKNLTAQKVTKKRVSKTIFKKRISNTLAYSISGGKLPG